MAKIVYIADVCKEIFAGGDVPKSALSYEKTAEYNVPIFSNGEKDCGLYGYTNNARVKEPSITVSARGTIGYTAIRTEPFVPVVRLITLTPKSEVIDLDYLFYATQNYRFEGSGTSIPQLTVPMLKKYKFQLPEMSHQKAIAVKFEKLDQLISLRKQQLAKLDELVKARFVEMFGKASLLAQNQTKRLEECCISISGGNTPSMQHPEYYGGNIPFVKSGDVKGDYIVESTLTLTKTALTETTAKILPKSTLIVVIRSAALLKEFRIGMLMVDAVINQDLKALQVSEDFLPVYLMWAIKMQHQVLLNKVQTMLTSHIRMEDLLNLKIGTPPLSLQNQFAAFVERVDQQKQTVQQSLEKLELMKKALMQEYFG